MNQTTRRAGVTLVELLITVVIGVVILGLTFSIVMANRQLMTRDQVNTELGQNLRIGADILGDDLRVAGQGFINVVAGNMPLTIQNNVITIRNRFIEVDEDTGAITNITQVRTYQLQGDILELQLETSRNGDDGPFEVGDVQGVINKVQSMRVRAQDRNGNFSNNLTTANDWNTLRAVEIQLVGATTIRGETFDSEITSSFFPRNVRSR